MPSSVTCNSKDKRKFVRGFSLGFELDVYHSLCPVMRPSERIARSNTRTKSQKAFNAHGAQDPSTYYELGKN